jgi:tetratricopeptide (TPR) repeat protein
MRIRGILILLVVGVVVLTAGSGWTEDLLEEGLAAQRAKNYPQAVELLGKYLKKYPHSPEAWEARAKALAALKRYSEALRDLDMGLSFNPRDIAMMLAKGKIQGQMERPRDAIATFTRVLDLEPGNTEALKGRAENLIQDSQLDKAILDLNRAVAMAPTDPWAYHKLGMAELCLNHFSEAAAAFSTAIRLAPEIPLFYFSRGQVYLHHLDSPEKAKADFKKGCELGHPLCCRELENMAKKPEKSPAKK